MATKKTTTSQEDAVFESGLDEVMAEMQLSQTDRKMRSALRRTLLNLALFPRLTLNR